MSHTIQDSHLAQEPEPAVTPIDQQRQVVHQQLDIYQGPIPEASELQKYENIHPGLADRIMKMAENQSLHRQEIEKNVINADVRRANIGLYFGFFIALAAISGSILLIIKDKPVSGFTIMLGTLVTIVGLFIHRASKEKAETK